MTMSSTRSISDDSACVPSNDQEPVYALVKRAEMNPADVEDAGAPTIEVTVLWERAILHVAHLPAAGAFTLTSEDAAAPSPTRALLPGLAVGATLMLVGATMGAHGNLPLAGVGALASAASLGGAVFTQRRNDQRAEDAARFVVGRDAIGRAEAPVVLRDGADGRFVVLPGARGEVEIDGVKRDLDALVAAGIAHPSSAVPGAHEINIVPGGRYRMELGNLSIQARVVAAGRRVAGAGRRDSTLRATWVASAAAAAVALGVMKMASQDAALLSNDDHDARLAELRAFVARQQEQSLQQPEAHEAAAVDATAGAAHQGTAGSMGDRRSEARNRRYEIRATGERPHLAREQTAREAVTARGIFASLGAAMRTGGSASGVVSPFGEMTEAGTGERNANGNINGADVGDAWGMAGLDTLGTGAGGGGHENGIGTGPLGTLGHGNCRPGDDCQYGRTQGSRLAARATRGPTVTPVRPDVDGQIPQEAIRRVVVRNIGQVNRCYEQGLNLNPTAAGRVSVRFVIAGGGAVLAVGVAQNELGIPSVGDCIANAVRRWQFPVPEASGPVTVTYPFMLNPADP
jgi:hypothetical protein